MSQEAFPPVQYDSILLRKARQELNAQLVRLEIEAPGRVSDEYVRGERMERVLKLVDEALRALAGL